MTDALRFEGVSKRYGRRSPPALSGLTCRFPVGAICGLVGPNGAGKTTAFSLVGGLLRADAGRVEVLGGPFDPFRLKGRLGMLPQDAELGDRHTPTELCAHLARLGGLSAAAADAAAEKAVAEVNLGGERGKRIGALSHGMRRRVAVAAALVGRPELVLLDEPTAGLDPVQASSLRKLLAEKRGATTLVVSSHDLDELERLCDFVVMIDRGKCVRQGTLAEVTGRSQVVEWTLGPGEVPMEEIRAALSDHSFALEGRTLSQRAPEGADLDAAAVVVAAALSRAGIAIREVRRGVSLERRFLDETGTRSPSVNT